MEVLEWRWRVSTKLIAPFDPIPETVADAVAAWDRGDSVFTVEMGGMGPGYEQCIHIAAFEIMRVWDGKFPTGEHWADDLGKDRAEELNAIADAEIKKLNYLGFSGAQVGAAKSLASCVCRRGYRAAMREEEVKDRLIQVSKNFPRAEAETIGGAS